MGDVDQLKIIIDRDECIGDGACADDAPTTFEMDDESKAILMEGSTDEREAILDAARNCPVDCIIIEDKGTGEKLCPEE